jgi:hypothetical protein
LHPCDIEALRQLSLSLRLTAHFNGLSAASPLHKPSRTPNNKTEANMKLQLITAVAVMLSTLGNHALAGVQSRPRKEYWDAVRSVPVGSEMQIVLKDGKSAKGRHVSSTDSELVVSDKGGFRQIQRDTVRRVYVLIPNSRSDAAAKGAAFGSLLGLAGVGGLTDENTGEHLPPYAAMIGFALIGVGIGALIGWIVAKSYKRTLIYEAA